MSDKTEKALASDEKPVTVSKQRYRAVVDLSYGDKRVSANDVVDDIPKESLGWLLEGHYIEKVK